MAIYIRRGEAYFVTKDWLVGDLHIPINIITDAITHTVSDNDFEAHQIEAYIRDKMTLFRPTHTEAAAVPSAEDISLEDTEGGRPWNSSSRAKCIVSMEIHTERSVIWQLGYLRP